MNTVLECIPQDNHRSLLRMQHNAEQKHSWMYMHANTQQLEYHPCFSEVLLREMKREQEQLRTSLASNNNSQLHHLVLASDTNVFNLGGDLSLFHHLIRSGNRGRLLEYAKLCVEVAYNFYRLYEDQVHSIAVVQGEALGGGFEAALCCHTIIMEEDAGMGFPEVLFNLFPGMGAYTFLTRRVTPIVAERMMLNAKVYSAQELYELGIVDKVVAKGQGLQAAEEIIKQHGRIHNALRSMQTVRQACRPIALDELLEVTGEWVDAAMRLDDRGLRTMERLIRAQTQRKQSFLRTAASA
jgi:DSF synthase